MTTLESLLPKLKDCNVLDDSIKKNEYIPIDLSIYNVDLLKIDCNNEIEFQNYINRNIKEKIGKVAFGGYNEIRNLYQKSSIFKNDTIEERNIHIGLDLWIKANSTIYAPLDGLVHSFNYNNYSGDYGPTLILKHTIKNITFHTLYGHLSLDSIAHLHIGMTIKKNQKIGTLGNSLINGGYSPHLHFQIIKDLENNFGDYPGVCSKKNLDFYLKNCPDPNLLLKIN